MGSSDAVGGFDTRLSCARVLRLPESDDLVDEADAEVTEIEVFHDGPLTCVRCGAVCQNGRWGGGTPGVKEAVREILEKLAELGLTISYKRLSSADGQNRPVMDG